MPLLRQIRAFFTPAFVRPMITDVVIDARSTMKAD
jgi:hypothetical protein